ncbi:MAG: nucleotidyl transferase AbiEii/AbiGii toxin family protein [Gammaproteobacteria bacterium]|nr:nucleotidyl transferase AbiEii/AbiGii toxin family protein [Gammaproteobacteria bacterium]MBU0788193.1 nucleotidyl transferase AbiEii/AbiGii toxin family protein [Gammaproteobacteria bacterium]MBU0815310.1 nucleotidyl transferase AbiEii/AbiGii toxin family protein [Gammaproteobacteria bacterium]MBU1785582.1 nucleotidyl transferase AbiEii/AbiGii toxin family protein [Gammaproteobacteria bacterium]
MVGKSSTAPTPGNLPGGVWQGLLQHALRLVDEIHQHGIKDPFWTFGGGTVLMLRYRHRHSKDIDIFVPDPQHLGYVSPRLSDVAEEVSHDYVEGSGYIKLIRPEGEIDFVASPNLTSNPFETWQLLGRSVRVETAAEIVAKKLWHRGDRVTARDLFDLSLVIEREPGALVSAAQYLVRHRDAFMEQLQSRSVVLQAQFDAIDVLEYKPTFAQAAERASKFLSKLPGSY